MAAASDEILREQVRKLIQDSETDDYVIQTYKEALVRIVTEDGEPKEIAEGALRIGEWFRS